MGFWKLRRGLKDFREVLWEKVLRECSLSKDIEGTEEVMSVAILRNYVLSRGNQQCKDLIWEACLAHSRNSKGIVEIKREREGIIKSLAFFFNESDYKLLRLLRWGNNMIWFMFEKDCSGSVNNSLTDFKVGSQGGIGSQLKLLEQFKWEVTVLVLAAITDKEKWSHTRYLWAKRTSGIEVNTRYLRKKKKKKRP